jgi:hypothetical protein
MMDLLKLLYFTTYVDAANVRDNQYAFLGVDDVRDIAVLPNHQHSESKVHTDFAVNYIEAKSNLKIIG